MSEQYPPNSRSKLRIENLSDLVFGLALSIGSIVLISKLPQTPSDLVSSIVLFAFSFLIVIWVWSSYTRTMSVLPFEVRGAFAVNIALLFCVAIEPYLFYVLDESPSLLEFSSSVYAVDVAAMLFLLAALVHLVRRSEGTEGSHRLSPAHLGNLRRVMITEVLSGSLFAVSALPFLWVAVSVGSYLRFDLWYGSFIVFFGLLRTGRSPQGGTASRTEVLASQE